jgi:hypothetical protein
MVIAVPNRVIFEHELARKRRVRVERYWGGSIELVIAQGADRGRGGGTVPSKQVERRFFRRLVILLGVTSVHLMDVIPRHSFHGLPTREKLCQLDFQRIHRRDVMYDDADLSAVPGDSRLPLELGQTAGEVSQGLGARLKALREGVRAAGRGARSGDF